VFQLSSKFSVTFDCVLVSVDTAGRSIKMKPEPFTKILHVKPNKVEKGKTEIYLNKRVQKTDAKLLKGVTGGQY